MENKKTVSEWLQEAKEHGYSWAQSAIEQTPEQRKQQYTSSLSASLLRAFDWTELKEGRRYWANIHGELLQKEYDIKNN